MKYSLFWILLVLVAYSVQPILVKLGYKCAVTPWQLLAMKNLVSAAVIIPIILMPLGLGKLRRTVGKGNSSAGVSSSSYFRFLNASEFKRIIPITILILGVNGFSLVALQMLPAVSVIVVTATIPVFVALFNKKLGREHLGVRFWCGAFLCLAGVFIAVDIFPAIAAGKFASGSVLGYLAVAGAAACAVIYRVNMEALTKDFDPRLLLMWAFGINALLVLVFVCPFMGAIPGEALPMALVIGLSAAVANTAMLLSIRAVGSTFISFIALLQKPLVIVAASIFLSEHLSLFQWLGVALLLIGLKLARPKRVSQ